MSRNLPPHVRAHRTLRQRRELLLRAAGVPLPEPPIGSTVCAWCIPEGIRTVLVERDSDGPESHGICPRHLMEFEAEVDGGDRARHGNEESSVMPHSTEG